MDALELLAKRASTSSKSISGVGPNPAQLEQLLQLAMRVPDHGRLAPWRFLVITGKRRADLSALLVQTRLADEPSLDDAALLKDRQRFLHAPMIITVVARVIKKHKIPEVEQRMSAGAVCMQLLNAAFAMGFAAQWLTGWAAYDPEILDALGIGEDEEITGFIHLGQGEPGAERARPELAEKLSYW
jgi:nitroreductase